MLPLAIRAIPLSYFILTQAFQECKHLYQNIFLFKQTVPVGFEPTATDRRSVVLSIDTIEPRWTRIDYFFFVIIRATFLVFIL